MHVSCLGKLCLSRFRVLFTEFKCFSGLILCHKWTKKRFDEAAVEQHFVLAQLAPLFYNVVNQSEVSKSNLDPKFTAQNFMSGRFNCSLNFVEN